VTGIIQLPFRDIGEAQDRLNIDGRIVRLKKFNIEFKDTAIINRGQVRHVVQALRFGIGG
jgi:hypothetical protein